MKLILIISASVALLGCQSIAPYPKDWQPPVASGSDCPYISGKFRNLGQSAREGPGEFAPSLVQLLRNRDYGEGATRRPDGMMQVRQRILLPPASTQTSIEQPDNATLVINFWRDGRSVETHTLSRPADFLCAEGRVEIRKRRTLTGGFAPLGIAGAAHEETTISFAPSSSHLVVEAKTRRAGVMTLLFVPMPDFHTSTVWYRYEREGESR